jgi:RNA-directed DNA polymerase
MKKIYTTIKVNNWQEIPWQDVMLKVRDLQNKIVKATLNNDTRLIYKLQNQLVSCFEARALAVRRVVTNSGGKTAGIDNITWDTPADRFKAIKELGLITKNPNKYKSSPLKRVLIPKANSTEMRPLGIPTLMDRSVQAVYHMAVDPVVETRSDKNSYGFRTGRSQHDAIAYIRSWLDKKYSPEYILETDIAKCFDKISHEFLLKVTPICHKRVLKEWLKSGYILKSKYYETLEGTPQGGIISPMLCNLALNGIEEEIRNLYPVNKTIKGGKPKVYLSRFADDMIVTGKDKETLLTVKGIIQEFLRIRGLELKEAKTRIVSIHEGFNFLGFNISRKTYNPRLNNPTEQPTVLIIKPSEKAIDSIKSKVKEIIRKNQEMAAIIRELNPVIRGWANYFRISYHSQSTYISIGHLVWKLMMKWVAHKHPNQSIFKSTAKYIVEGKTASNHKWVWGVRKQDEDKENKLVILNISETKIKQHPLLKLDKNPYLLEDREYFDRRVIEKNSAKFRELIFKKYKHLCPLCLESLHNGEKVELHHVIPVKEGGKYTVSNIQPLHEMCHKSITHRTD